MSENNWTLLGQDSFGSDLYLRSDLTVSEASLRTEESRGDNPWDQFITITRLVKDQSGRVMGVLREETTGSEASSWEVSLSGGLDRFSIRDQYGELFEKLDLTEQPF